ncbi:ABC transporter ATP-binding protein [Neptuniibacter sp. CAU 1671]|uniref:ABC transporter transmembrane domain-containing protein n=1 Tax=Neptuniibacter sp. CAU 1671 TaxID=3032593 RepID=UPI0023DA0D87|nr:ABC transporter ATP-binding protein [Neptuniibacter sp. CAU 1671]MDF2181062.1 ABC transporter ATP-binding protein [Neptuniibacter sp. CAU 1671]
MLPSVLADPKRRGLYLLLVLTGIGQSVALLSLIALARNVIEQAQTIHSLTSLWLALAGISLLALGRFSERFVAEKMANHYIMSLRQQVFQHALVLGDAGRKGLVRGGALLRLTGDMSAIRNWIVQGAAPLLVLGSWLAVSMLALAWLNPWLLFSLMPVFLLSLCGNYLLGRKLYSCSETARKRKTQLIRNATEKLRTVELVQSYNQQGREARRFQRQGKRLYQAQLDRARLSGLLRGFNEAMLGLSLLALLVMGLYLVSVEALALSELSLLLAASLYQLTHLRRLGRLYEFWTLRQVAVDKLLQFFHQKTIVVGKRERKMSADFSMRLKAFSSAGRFNSVTAQISPGARIRLEGPRESGKTSLLEALCGLVSQTSGQLLLNGRSLSQVSHSTLARQVALVSQQLPLLRGTGKKNLFYGLRKEEPAYTEEVLRLCGLNDWIGDQAEGLKSAIEEGGRNLSSTLQFRLMLARALLRRPALLMIDQHPAFLDPSIEQLLIRLWKWFPGALIVVRPPQLLHASAEVWQLSGDDAAVIHPAPQSSGVSDVSVRHER